MVSGLYCQFKKIFRVYNLSMCYWNVVLSEGRKFLKCPAVANKEIVRAEIAPITKPICLLGRGLMKHKSFRSKIYWVSMALWMFQAEWLIFPRVIVCLEFCDRISTSSSCSKLIEDCKNKNAWMVVNIIITTLSILEIDDYILKFITDWQ